MAKILKCEGGIQLLMYAIYQITDDRGQPPIGSGTGHALTAVPWAVISTARWDMLR
jgi:hypothetical protein